MESNNSTDLENSSNFEAPTTLNSKHDKNSSIQNPSIDIVELKSHKKLFKKANIDVEKSRYPFCIVWSPLPVISFFLPIIGHTGICKYLPINSF